MTEDEQNAVFDNCFEHSDHLRANGHLVGEIALQPPETAVTLYWKNGKPATPFQVGLSANPWRRCRATLRLVHEIRSELRHSF